EVILCIVSCLKIVLKRLKQGPVTGWLSTGSYNMRQFWEETNMYTYGSIYLIAKDFDKSGLFYRELFLS
ncbi:MAG: hypothetical protein K2G55_04185, partial [Lachnospiraceae bacterium]|nr:hypothetical protein [Lachnospiraceae bacterium]